MKRKLIYGLLFVGALLFAIPAFATYPAAVTTFTTKTDGVDLVSASHINAMQTDITAIETELGTDPAGSMTDLKSRLAIIIDGYGAVANGTAFPTVPTTVSGQLFFRTDTDKMYRRNAANEAWNDISASVGDYVAGTTYIEAAADTERTTNSTSYVLLKQFSPLARAGTIALAWQMKTGAFDRTAYSKVYINDIAVGTEKTKTGSTDYADFTEATFTVAVGDVIQIYGKISADTDVYLKLFKIKCTNPTTLQETASY